MGEQAVPLGAFVDERGQVNFFAILYSRLIYGPRPSVYERPGICHQRHPQKAAGERVPLFDTQATEQLLNLLGKGTLSMAARGGSYISTLAF